MIFDFLKKQKDINKKRELIVIMINSIHVSEDQKFLYLEALEVLDKEGIEKLYKEISSFTQEFELKELDDIQKSNFSKISGLRQKEAEEKKKELNSFSFLLHNL